MDPLPDYGLDSYKGTGKLQDKVAVITGKNNTIVSEMRLSCKGGDSGIGRAVALAFAREGASIVISYYDEHEDAQVIQKAVQEAGRECILIVRFLLIQSKF